MYFVSGNTLPSLLIVISGRHLKKGFALATVKNIVIVVAVRRIRVNRRTLGLFMIVFPL
jgi:hypothetical protein